MRGKVGVTSAVDKKMVQACEEKVCRWDNKERYWLQQELEEVELG